MSEEKKYNAFTMDLDTYLEIVSLAQKNGKKPGDSMTEELNIIIKQKSENIKFLGETDMDVDMLTGELRSNNPKNKILNLNELTRQMENKNE